VTTRSPPQLATWLLESLGSGVRAEELIGDLTEQFADGRSRFWYWRQAIGAIAVRLRRAPFADAPSFVAAVLVGYAANSLWRLGNSLVLQPLYGTLDASPHPFALDTLARFSTLRVSQFLLTALAFVSGWLVTRIHRTHQRAVVLAFAVAVIAPRLPGNADVFAGVIQHAQPWSALVPALMPTALQCLCALVAGLWVIHPMRFARMGPQIRFVTILTAGLAVGSAFLYDAWQVGLLTYPASLRYPIDAAELASGAYLAFLLWRSEARSTPAIRKLAEQTSHQ
jgi:hypothetical protein